MKKIITELRQGHFVIVADDKNRENEADLVMAAEFITPTKIVFMLEHCSGIICVPMSSARVSQIGLPKIKPINQGKKMTPYTVPVDALATHTGVSAQDRCMTIKKLGDDRATLSDFIVPGHVFPLYAQPSGLNQRQGHTEAAVELMKLAGLKEVAVICELRNSGVNCQDKNRLGEMMNGKEVDKFARRYNLKKIDIGNLCKKN